MNKFNTVVELVTTECYRCGVVFALPETLNNTCLRNGQEFFCPNGHGQVYSETAEGKLGRANDRIAYLENLVKTSQAAQTRLEKKLKKCQESKPVEGEEESKVS